MKLWQMPMKVDKVLKCSSVQLQFDPYKNWNEREKSWTQWVHQKTAQTEKGHKCTGCWTNFSLYSECWHLEDGWMHGWTVSVFNSLYIYQVA